MAMQELFYGDNEPTWIMPSYQEVHRVYNEQESRHYAQNVAPRYRSQYYQTHDRALSPPRLHENVPHYAQETRYMPVHVGPRYMTSIVNLKVPLCCTKCEEKVKDALLDMEGVEMVQADPYNKRVTVTGVVDPMRVLKRVKKFKKHSEIVSHIPYHRASTYNDTAVKSYSYRPELSQLHRQELPASVEYVQEFYNPLPASSGRSHH